MREALRLARKGTNRPSREPLVGGVVLADSQVVGRGFAREKGSAIVSALDRAGALARGATIYTNAEPGSDSTDIEGCLRRIIECRPDRLVIGLLNHPEDARPALERLRAAGIKIETGLCEQECREANERYLKFSKTGEPFVTVKFAETLDGRIATASGDSQWISSTSALKLAHQLRREHDAILVGIGTLLADDPRLTVRLVNGRDPLRVVVDSRLRIPLGARVIAGGAAHHTLIATTDLCDTARAGELEKAGAEVLRLPKATGRSGVDLSKLLAELGRRKVASVLVEGGAGIMTSLLSAGKVDRLVVAIAPKIIGRGREAIGELGITRLSEAITFSSIKMRRLGPDMMFDGRLTGFGEGS